tara:strand:+ start:1431 stop:3284 length:1854 start_codon:yes stop_codon:yes gene_type:complete
MKKAIILFVISFLSFSVNSQDIKEKSITSKVNSATIFLNSAQVNREKKVQLEKGIQLLKFVDLSPFVDKKSIQIKAKDIEIQAVNFQKNYLSNRKKNPELIALEKTLSGLTDKIDIENINTSSVQEEIQFLKDNRSIKGNQTLTVTALQAASRFYSSQMKISKTKELNFKNKIKKLQNKRSLVIKQISDLTSKKNFASGEIFVKVKSTSTKIIDFQLTYNVSNVGWYPTYDVRVSDINSPLTLVYKANVKQNSQVDWKNVKLRFSSANPSQSTKAGTITPYFLDYGTRPPNYKGQIDEIMGYVKDQDGALPGVSILIKGTTIGTETDFSGRYSIKIPDNNATLVFSYLGYETVERRAYGSTINVTMQEGGEVLEEIAVAAYGRSLKSKKRKLQIRGSSSIVSADNFSIPTKEIINQTSVSFEIVEPYSIQSSNKDYVVSMKTYQSDADYTYYAIPRIEESAFLLASLKNWEQYHLLEGEANVYFENTFVGTTLIDTRSSKKVLDISLGMDKNVTVKRTRAKDFTTKQFIGNKKEETSVWDIVVKNNKSQAIKMTVLDQIPISTREEIKITLDKLFNGQLDKGTGKVTWDFSLAPKNTKSIQLKYAVQYPKSRSLMID